MWFTVAVVTVCAVLISTIRYYANRSKDCATIGVPIVGGFLHSLSHYSDRFDWLTERADALGPVYQTHMPCYGLVTQTSEPADVEHILKGNFSNFDKGWLFKDLFNELLGDGIFNSDGDVWRVQRKAASHMFSVNSMRHYMSAVMMNHATTLRDKLLASKGERVDMQDCFYRFTLDSVGEIAFGVNVNSQQKERVPFAEAFDYCQAHSSTRVYRPYLHHIIRLFHRMGLDTKFYKQLRVLNAFAQQVINVRKKDTQLEGRNDLLSRFIHAARSEGKEASNTYLRNQIMNYTIAGRDTTAQALSWCVYELLTHPEALTKMLQEIDTVVGEEGKPDYATVMQMPYTTAVVKETLRLHPSVPVDLKVVNQDDVLPGQKVHVPKGSLVMYTPYVMGRRTELWGPDARTWRPARWEEMRDSNSLPNAFKYPVFNAGYRTCLGQKMAVLEAVTCLSTLFKDLEFTLLSKNVTYGISVTLPVKNGLWVSARARK